MIIDHEWVIIMDHQELPNISTLSQTCSGPTEEGEVRLSGKEASTTADSNAEAAGDQCSDEQGEREEQGD